MTDWTIRGATPADAETLALVGAATFLEAFAGRLGGRDIVAHCRAQHNAAKYVGWIADQGSRVVLAEHASGGAPIGYTVLTAPDLPLAAEPGDIELKRIYTLATIHGQGLGPALMARALIDAAAISARRVLLGVYHGNARARRFYEREGFTVAGTRRFQVGETLHDDFIYARAV